MSGNRGMFFDTYLPFNVGYAAFLYGIMLAGFVPYNIIASLRASISSDWRTQPLKKFTSSWIRLAAIMPFM